MAPAAQQHLGRPVPSATAGEVGGTSASNAADPLTAAATTRAAKTLRTMTTPWAPGTVTTAVKNHDCRVSRRDPEDSHI